MDTGENLPVLTAPLVELIDAKRTFAVRVGPLQRAIEWAGHEAPAKVRAVDGVDLAIMAGEVVGLVGESGSGKSTLGRLVAGLLPLTSGVRHVAGHVESGEPSPGGKDALKVQMIFQDPYASLNPRMRVGDAIGEAPVFHGLIAAADKTERVSRLLEEVGIDARDRLRFPHQFSGGQRARIGIARALAVSPALLVCDEAVAALDVSIQAQILNLFDDLREWHGLTYLFISHDLAVVRHLADRVLIMYLGRIVEEAPAADLFASPNHPYSQGLLAEAPTLKVGKRAFIAIKGEIPSPLSPPAGCHFHPRCPHTMVRCRVEDPLLKEIAPGRFSACHLNDVA